MKKICLILTAVLTVTLTTAHAADFDDFDDGVAFARAGDYATAFVIFNRLAEQGDADGQFNLALMYLGGDGVTQSHVMAAYWTKLAAEQGHAGAQNNLGLMYYNGDGVAQDYAVAVKWYTFAAEQGYADAQYSLGAIYAFGGGVLQDYVLAFMWGHIAAVNDNEAGAQVRDFAVREMAKAEITTAQKMARECMASNYENCEY